MPNLYDIAYAYARGRLGAWADAGAIATAFARAYAHCTKPITLARALRAYVVLIAPKLTHNGQE